MKTVKTRSSSVPTEVTGFKMHLEAVGTSTVTVFVGPVSKTRAGGGGPDVASGRTLSSRSLRVRAERYHMTSAPDGLRINAHGPERVRKPTKLEEGSLQDVKTEVF